MTNEEFKAIEKLAKSIERSVRVYDDNDMIIKNVSFNSGVNTFLELIEQFKDGLLEVDGE